MAVQKNVNLEIKSRGKGPENIRSSEQGTRKKKGLLRRGRIMGKTPTKRGCDKKVLGGSDKKGFQKRGGKVFGGSKEKNGKTGATKGNRGESSLKKGLGKQKKTKNPARENPGGR